MRLKITFILTILIYSISKGQVNNDSVLLIPEVGMVLNNDTIMLESETPESLFTKIDTTDHQTTIFYSKGISCGYSSFIDSITGAISYKRDSWISHYCQIWVHDNNIEFEFEGTSKDSLKLKLIMVDYPTKAQCSNGLKIGDNYNDIFKVHSKTDGSYNCGEMSFAYCYFEEGISYSVKPFKENPFPEMFERIIGFEIYTGRK